MDSGIHRWSTISKQTPSPSAASDVFRRYNPTSTWRKAVGLQAQTLCYLSEDSGSPAAVGQNDTFSISRCDVLLSMIISRPRLNRQAFSAALRANVTVKSSPVSFPEFALALCRRTVRVGAISGLGPLRAFRLPLTLPPPRRK